MEVKGKRIIITGGANGIGRELVESLINRKAIVGVVDVDKKGLEQLTNNFSGHMFQHCDVVQPDAVEKFVRSFVAVYDGIDILVNCAGIIRNSPLISFSMSGLIQHDIKMWDNVIATNLNAVFYMTRSVVKEMLQNRIQGLVINVSSICAAGNSGQSAYSAAKAGVNALTVTWAKELGGMGIRVAGIAPGFALTQTTVASMSEEVLEEWKDRSSLRRLASPDEIVEGILYIIKNDFFHGRTLEIDGGLRL